ncbi:hypothetical protein [Streptomyces chromofuscus]|uniref:Uncharacterized protein n=1 Tax=Streptomyces chromofuscus TaxID=42881 RepID=A0A7M2TIY6_STRCW|nr:hypothetical protein [Streptomyces chromofuscus]QOV47903.1 hypothetical protein IPT68_33180 [Streptomyces chromofuscus]GGT22733.1 hypothetical protein GCM10010254_48970 [Streptomyces chromofuscus]
MTRHSQDGKHPEEHAEMAGEEVLREIRDAERRTEESPEERRHRGEAGEAITPNTGAQEQSQGD